MKKMSTIVAALAATLLLAACAKKEEAASVPEAAPEAAPVEELAPADANSMDAEQTGGDKVSEPPPPAETG